VKIDIRVMWYSDDDREIALEIAKELYKILKARGYIVKRSKVYPNRRHDGARIYLRIRGYIDNNS